MDARRRGARLIAGVDEAGCGPWAGPVVAAAVILPDYDVRSRASRTLSNQRIRIDDSKRLTPAQRLHAAGAIRLCAHVGVGIVPHEAIDTLNIHQATLLAMRRAVDDLPILPDVVFVDGLHVPELPMPCRAIVDGDHLSYTIGCASIVAKTLRDDLMRFYDRLFPDYGFATHKGYGVPRHREALSRLGPSWLHRRSFAPIRDALAASADATVPAGQVDDVVASAR